MSSLARLVAIGFVVACNLYAADAAAAAPEGRVPAVPLVTHDPYFSVWSCADALNADWPRHWTGAIHALASAVRVDGKTYRLMGVEPKDAPPAAQVGLAITPTRTTYEFQAGPVKVALTFVSPLLPNDLLLFSRPVTYLTWEARATDGHAHKVAVYYDNSSELVVDRPDQPVRWSRPSVEGQTVLCIGSAEQAVLAKAGDDLRIDWGHLYVAAPSARGTAAVIAAAEPTRAAFVRTGTLPAADDSRMPRPANQDWPVAAFAFDLGNVSYEPATAWLMLAYDDEFSIQYLGTNLRPFWRTKLATAEELLRTAAADRADVLKRAEAFDAALMADMERAGGKDYARFCALCYRQAMAAHKLTAGPDGAPMLFSKECFSNGCIATVDVLYPAAPVFAFLSNELLKASVRPVHEYAALPRWKFDFAPHDLGTYPLANGQVYGGGEQTEENQMPVEESGNMLIVADVICRLDGSTAFADKYWKELARWAEFLKRKGLDPENQLCTDDFAGHLAHNANLSVKAIVALAAYADMCRMKGDAAAAKDYRALAESFAEQWVKLAADGDHYRLAFDKSDSWSQKYNLVWDKLLGLKLFPPEVVRTEIAYYKTKLRKYGLPLDNRSLYTKTDWQIWTATLADSREDFEALTAGVYAFVRATPQRVPVTDWYWTDSAKQQGFQARPVIGGVFIKMLADPALWKKWAGGGK